MDLKDVDYSTTAGAVITIISFLSVIANLITIVQSHQVNIGVKSRLSLKILAASALLESGLSATNTCLALTSGYLGNNTWCGLQGTLTRLARTLYSLTLVLKYAENLWMSLANNPRRNMAKIGLIVFTSGWIIIALVFQLPIIPTTRYVQYGGLFGCDISHSPILITADAYVNCITALATLAMSAGVLVSDSHRSLQHRISYFVHNVEGVGAPTQDSNNENYAVLRKVANAGLFVSFVTFIEWVVRMIAVLCMDEAASRSLFTMSIIIMIASTMCTPAMLLSLSQLPAMRDDGNWKESVFPSDENSAQRVAVTSFTTDVGLRQTDANAATPPIVRSKRMQTALVTNNPTAMTRENDVKEQFYQDERNNSITCQSSVGPWMIRRSYEH